MSQEEWLKRSAREKAEYYISIGQFNQILWMIKGGGGFNDIIDSDLSVLPESEKRDMLYRSLVKWAEIDDTNHANGRYSSGLARRMFNLNDDQFQAWIESEARGGSFYRAVALEIKFNTRGLSFEETIQKLDRGLGNFFAA